MLLHYVECLDRNGWYRYELTFASPYGAEQFAKTRRAMNHTVRVVDEDSEAEPASSGVVSPRNWVLKALWVEGHTDVIEVVYDRPFGRTCCLGC